MLKICAATLLFLIFGINSQNCTHDPNNNFVFWTCPRTSNSNVWYGLSLRKENLRAAAKACADMGPLDNNNKTISKLIWIDEQEIDFCVYDLMNFWRPDGGEKILIGAYYEEFENDYKWISYDSENTGGLLLEENSLEFSHFLNKSEKPSFNGVAAYERCSFKP